MCAAADLHLENAARAVDRGTPHPFSGDVSRFAASKHRPVLKLPFMPVAGGSERSDQRQLFAQGVGILSIWKGKTVGSLYVSS